MSDRENMPTKDLIRSCGTLLSKIPGVFSVNVSTDSLGDISDIHILATTRRNAKQISRDVQSALAAAFKLEIDHRIISIAQIESDTYAGVDCRDRNAEIRLRYTGMNVSMRSGKRTYQVRLSRDDEEFLGEAECANAPRQKRRAVAEATIQALEAALGLEGKLGLVLIHNIDLEGIQVVLTAIECPEASDGRLLIGAAHCARNDDEAECVVRSTLDALNRFCGRLSVQGWTAGVGRR
ncbi:MAG: hypothetical protein GX592_11330 [Clostridiales bacterium]|nr:hypothetical protein [Clostridiales bacterium]